MPAEELRKRYAAMVAFRDAVAARRKRAIPGSTEAARVAEEFEGANGGLRRLLREVEAAISAVAGADGRMDGRVASAGGNTDAEELKSLRALEHEVKRTLASSAP